MKNILGFYYINAPHSILNNAGSDEGARTDNCVIVKKIKKGRESYVYVSPQAFRYWFRNSLKNEKGWNLSPITRDKKIAFTEVNPVEYEDDDMFGYMKTEGGTVTRISPFKCSPLISVFPERIVNDYAVMSRHEGVPVPYEYEFYSTVLKGIFAIDVDNSGYFIKKEKAGYKNISDDFLKKYKDNGNVEIVEDGIKLKREEKVKRIKDMIEVIPYLTGGAKETTHLTDIVPRFIILLAINGGNHILMDIAKTDGDNATINLNAFKEMLSDYDDRILTNIYIGIADGFNDKLKEELLMLSNDFTKKKIIVSTVKDACFSFSREVENIVD
ncbi:type I-B CRISPR-associated protein Cas7/Cst2/DevR [Caloramator sp. ALD01]|uniref:type I-B CRISPR-associated protein Cas7/Cst2/DevR n=1 Tax=Caloramator sp. ALD01 TaxID=1031288 RepID=UPI00041037DC|nr:type I-B CRISPR-associated protein Cas7/Cst2/DevR [Caloramator sp. ALD01]